MCLFPFILKAEERINQMSCSTYDIFGKFLYNRVILKFKGFRTRTKLSCVHQFIINYLEVHNLEVPHRNQSGMITKICETIRGQQNEMLNEYHKLCNCSTQYTHTCIFHK